MKVDKKKKKVILYSLLITSIIFVPLFLLDRVFPTVFVTTVRDTIEITSDADFAKYNFPGDGSKENPILISDLEIGTRNRRIRKAYKLLVISNTSYHIVIENCSFNGGPYTIWISRLRNGSVMIQNNSFFSVEHYIGLDGWYPMTQIYISFSRDIKITNNKFEGKSWGLALSDVTNLTFSNNTFITEEYSGLETNQCQNLTIERNLIKGGFYFSYTDNLYFCNNRISFGTYGLYFENCNNSLIIGNLFSNCTNFAITLDSETMFSELYHNSFFENNIEGVSQAQDLGYNNTWFNMLLLEGNYWSDIGGNSTYAIAGIAGSVDLYPLLEPISV